MKKFTQGTLTDRLARFFYHYRNTPHTTTGVTPSELLMSRRPRSRLDIIRPDLHNTVYERQQRQKETRDSRASDRELSVGDVVYARGYGQGQSKWIPARIVQRTGPVSFKVELEGGNIWCRHQNQLCKRFDITTETTYRGTANETTTDSTEQQPPRVPPRDSPEPSPQAPKQAAITTGSKTSCNHKSSSSPTTGFSFQFTRFSRGSPSYPTRDRQPPERLTY